ncbi:flagellar assembly protein FliW [Planococcus lenghuensis]|uniref:Flagellar assembly factor FliW n=1 Tax=Planococcus lenghuensis TaxID=2213202 RepID=A0A1Q2L170_9BACL|nr:flagellar assembly protein FliW [Planococcus lenghuensis]AQQ54156.1 flagellar assembly protein FliW [Planococcus lenghuensis]
MKVQTERFGELEVANNRIITFQRGIPGFEEFKQYALIPADAQKDTPFFFLQSIEEGAISFFLVDPFAFFGEYDVKLEEQAVERLKLVNPSDAIVLTTVTVQDEMKDATTNLKAPLIINNKKQQGMQVVLNNKDYQIKQPLFQPEPKAALRQV